MKLLIISHNPITTYHNMGKTLMSLFSCFEKHELCQLYIYPTNPDVDFCISYYRVTDKDILKFFFSFKKPGASVPREKINREQKMYENLRDEVFYSSRKNKLTYRRILRDTMWKCCPWYNKNLKEWLKKEKPQCIFVAPGDAMFLYDVALKIANELAVPIISYICDDYFFVEKTGSMFENFRIKLLKRKISSLMSKTEKLIAISEEIKNEYTDYFGVSSEVIMTGADRNLFKNESDEKCEIMSYFGNLRCNRFLSVAQVGTELDKLNESDGKNRVLKIYTSEKDEEILSSLKKLKSVELCGFVTGEGFKKAVLDSHVLLHAEAFDKESVQLVKHSVSTKIADSLTCGIPLLAYGPKEVSSMKHLLKNECAAIAIDKDELQEALKKVFHDSHFRERCRINAMKAAEKFHNSEKNSRKIYETVTIAIAKTGGKQ